jgi:hypothetical protein
LAGAGRVLIRDCDLQSLSPPASPLNPYEFEMHTEFGWRISVCADDCDTPEIATDTADPQVPLDLQGLPLDNLDVWAFECLLCHKPQNTSEGMPRCWYCGWTYVDQLHTDIQRLLTELQFDHRFRSTMQRSSVDELEDETEKKELTDV